MALPPYPPGARLKAVLGRHRAGETVIGTNQLLILFLLFFLLFGAKELPKLARSLGQAKGEFQAGLTDAKNATETDLDRAGKTEEIALADAADEAGVETEGKTVEEVESAVEDAS